MKKKYSIEEHRQGLIELYEDQLRHKSDTTFMKAVLTEAIRVLKLKYSDPKKVERWVVKRDRESISFKTFTLKNHI